MVLRTLSQPPFEPLAFVDLKELSLKTALLLALASAKSIGDVHAFSVNSDYISFGPGDCSVTLLPRLGYVLPNADCFIVFPVFRVIDLV